MNYSFSILFTSTTIGVYQKETKRKCLVQHTSGRSNGLWKTTIFVENSLWNSVMMAVRSQEKEVPISVLGLLTIDGSEENNNFKEHNNIFMQAIVQADVKNRHSIYIVRSACMPQWIDLVQLLSLFHFLFLFSY